MAASLQWGLAATLAVWGALSILVQFPGFKGRMRRFDPFALLPDWGFFAPTPAKGDFHILYRDRGFGETEFGDWIECTGAGDRSPWNAFWNPDRRTRKATFDVCTELAKKLQENDGPEVQGTIPYLLILHRISSFPRPEPAEATQFMVMLSHGIHSLKEPSIMHLSVVHGLEQPDDGVAEEMIAEETFEEVSLG